VLPTPDSHVRFTLASAPWGLHRAQVIHHAGPGGANEFIAPRPEARRDIQKIRNLIADIPGPHVHPRWPAHAVKLEIFHHAGHDGSVTVTVTPLRQLRRGSQRRWQSLAEITDTILEAIVGHLITHHSQVEELDVTRAAV
jgi:hypothetical protein